MSNEQRQGADSANEYMTPANEQERKAVEALLMGLREIKYGELRFVIHDAKVAHVEKEVKIKL